MPPASVVVRPEVGVTVMPARVVVDVCDRDVGRIDPTITAASNRRSGDDRIANAAVADQIINASNRHSLRRIPVCVVKGQRRRETVPSVRSLEVRPMLTLLPPGEVLRTTVNVAVPPLSVVTRPDVGVTVMPAARVASHDGQQSGRERINCAGVAKAIVRRAFQHPVSPYAPSSRSMRTPARWPDATFD